MKIKAPWKCDYCGAVKGENNHWFLRDKESPDFLLAVWSDELAADERAEHICGSVCAGRALEKWIGGNVGN